MALLVIGQPARLEPIQDRGAEQPFSYERRFDLAQQKVVFNPIGQYATDVTFAHIQLRVPFRPYFDMAEELQQDLRRIQNISKILKQEKDDVYWTARNQELAKILDNNLPAVLFPVNMAFD